MKAILIAIFILQCTHILSMEPTHHKDYLFMQEGMLPLLITVSHGGTKEIPGCAKRQSGRTLQDRNTVELAHDISRYCGQTIGRIPFVVAALFSREFVDANRIKKRAFEDHKLAPLYDEYHATIKRYISILKEQYPKGVLLLDIHGQKKEPEVIHRGTKNGDTVKNCISQHGIATISGQQSIFGMLAQKRYVVFPPVNESNDIPESIHFDGGFTVREYGKDAVDAIQIEIGTELREKSEYREKLVRDLSEVVMLFLRDYYIPSEK